MRIAVVGTGGVGGYFGARLAAEGNPVTFVARGQHLEAIQRNGLTVQSSRGDLHLDNVHAVDSIRKVEAVDLILIAVKLWDTEEVASALTPLAEGGAAILSLQNGVEKDDVLRRFLPTESVVGGVCYISASIARPGVIGHHGAIQRIAFGESSGRESARTQVILEACRQAAIDADISLDIQRLIWEKFVFLVGLSGTHRNPNRTEGWKHPPASLAGPISGRLPQAAAREPAPGATQTSLFRRPVVYESAIHANFAKCMAAEFMQ
jgi:2-dehydropantoate 2-reductase